MSAEGGQKGLQPSTLPDLRRRPGWSPYTGLQDPVVTGADRSSSDPTMNAAWYFTILHLFASAYVQSFEFGVSMKTTRSWMPCFVKYFENSSKRVSVMTYAISVSLPLTTSTIGREIRQNGATFV